jgi:hypothetical protein
VPRPHRNPGRQPSAEFLGPSIFAEWRWHPRLIYYGQKWLGHAQLTTTALYANAVGEEEQKSPRGCGEAAEFRPQGPAIAAQIFRWIGPADWLPYGDGLSSGSSWLTKTSTPSSVM